MTQTETTAAKLDSNAQKLVRFLQRARDRDDWRAERRVSGDLEAYLTRCGVSHSDIYKLLRSI